MCLSMLYNATLPHSSTLRFYSRRYKRKWEYCWWNSGWCGDISPGHYCSHTWNHCSYLATEKVHPYILGMFKLSCLCVLCRKKLTIKGLFPSGHFKVAHKQGASPHAQDISLDQLSSEPRLCVCQLRILVTLFSVFISWRKSGRTRAIH